MKNDGFFKLAVIVGAISWMAIFAFVPNVLVFLASFSSTSTQNFIEPGFSFSNYARLMDATHLDILLSSLRLSGLVTFICLVTAYPFAAILARTPSRCATHCSCWWSSPSGQIPWCAPTP